MKVTSNEQGGELHAHGEALQFLNAVVGYPQLLEGTCDLLQTCDPFNIIAGKRQPCDIL